MTIAETILNEKEFQTIINKHGFLLEYQVEKLLKLENPDDLIKRNYLIKMFDNREGEIDIFRIKENKFCYLIECKKTNHSLFFVKENIEQFKSGKIYNDKFKFKILSKVLIPPIDHIEFGQFLFSMELENDKPKLVNNKDAIYSLQIVDKWMDQLKNNIEIFSHYTDCAYEFLIPLIVTNSKLYLVEFDYNDITKTGDLNFKKMKCKEVPYIVLNLKRQLFLNGALPLNDITVYITNFDNLKKIDTELYAQYCCANPEKTKI